MTGTSRTLTAAVTAQARPWTSKRVGLLVLVAVAYYLGGRLGLGLALVEDSVSPLWPPTGIAVAAFLLYGRSLWPGVAVAALAVNLPLTVGPLAAVLTAAGNTLSPLVAVTLLNRVGFRRQLDRQRDAVAIVFLGALVAMTISATVGTVALAVTQHLSLDRLATAWVVWWTGDAMGVLIVTPFLLSLPLHWEQERWTGRQWAEAGASLGLSFGAVLWITPNFGVLFATLPVVGWAAWRLQLRGAAPAALVTSAIATWSAARGTGPFATRSLLERMFTLQGFNASVALTSFILASLVSERLQAARALEASATELEERVRRRTAELSTLNARLLAEVRERSAAQQQLGEEEARTRKEHDIAETLQRSLLPARLPDVPGIGFAVRYVPATSDFQVGGDLYDVIPLPGGLVGLTIGDVAGHGIQATSTMVQVRTAVRAYALQDPSPPTVMRKLHRLAGHITEPEMVTLLYALYDPATRRLRFTNAGHPPPLVFGGGTGTFLTDALWPPLGVSFGTASDAVYTEATHDLSAGSALLLYTDGLVERRGESILTGLDRLRDAAAGSPADDLEVVCDRLLSSLLDTGHVTDDVALVLVRPTPVGSAPLRLEVPAEARLLADVRGALRTWLRDSGVARDATNDILVACGEACANVVQHAYRGAPGGLRVEAHLRDGALEVIVADHGTWRAPNGRGGGWGLQLMRALMDTVHVDQGPDGTRVRMSRRHERRLTP